jgi:hypothetical protein
VPDANRLQELRRQRALVQEQLAWLDREIAALAALAAPSAAAAPLPAPRVAASSTPAEILPAKVARFTTEEDALMAEFAAEEGKRGAITKGGCWTIFLSVMAAGIVITVVIVYLVYR